MMKKILISCILFFSVTTYTQAQTAAALTADIVPQNYQPNEQVTINLRSFSIDVDRQLIIWTIDNKVVQEGVGKKRFVTTAPPLNEVKRITIQVGNVQRVVTLRTKRFEIYTESIDGYTPPWYRGKSKIAEESAVRAVLISDTFPINNTNNSALYRWKRGNAIDSAQSGAGRQAFVVPLSPFDAQTAISVTFDGREKEIFIRPSPTQISLYENSPLFGTRFNEALQNKISLKKDDLTFEVVPWFFSLGTFENKNMSFVWTVNGLPTTQSGPRNIFNVRKGDRNRGKATIGIRVQHKEKTLQSNRKTLDIEL